MKAPLLFDELPALQRGYDSECGRHLLWFAMVGLVRDKYRQDFADTGDGNDSPLGYRSDWVYPLLIVLFFYRLMDPKMEWLLTTPRYTGGKVA